jgi:predicted small metal-binding protein
MTRKVADCRLMPSESNCTLTIGGEEDEVVRAAAMHAVDVHGHTAGPDLDASIRALLVNESPVPA